MTALRKVHTSDFLLSQGWETTTAAHHPFVFIPTKKTRLPKQTGLSAESRILVCECSKYYR